MDEEKYNIIKQGKLRGDKIKYKDRINCTLWKPFKHSGITDEEDEESGLSWDFSFEDIDDLLELIKKLKESEPDIYDYKSKEHLDWEKFENKQKVRDEKWWYKIYQFLKDITFQFAPFDWKLTTMLVFKKSPSNKKLMYTWVSGFVFGPFTITWGRS